MAKLAVIPPISLCDAYKNQGYYLYLPQLLWHPTYQSWVYETVEEPDAYTILDNGAFEGTMTSIPDLFDIAWRFGINEIVIPDVMRDMAGTIDQLKKFESASKEYRIRDRGKTNFMAVVQGRSVQECFNCVSEISKFPFVTAIGVPKHLCATVGRTTRMQVLRYIDEKWDNAYQVHFLGGVSQYPTEVNSAKRYECFRGMDTSMPFFAAYHGESLVMRPSGMDNERPPKYFDLAPTDLPERLTKLNVETLRKWAQ